MVWVPLVLVLVATGYDLCRREVPDWIALLLLAWAVIATAFHLHAVGWLSALAGLGIALGVTVVLFVLGGLGGGDVKLTAALGAVLGHAALPGFFLLVALAGGPLAGVAALRGKQDLAYVPAIAVGLGLFLCWQEGWGNALAMP